MNKVAVFTDFLNTFETEELKLYCRDMIEMMPDYIYTIPSSTSHKYHNATQCQPGGQLYHILMACEIINYILGLEYIQKKWDKPKQRDCFRVAICLHDSLKCGTAGSTFTVHEHPMLTSEWIKNTKVEHEIDQKLKNYIARLVESHSGQWTTSTRSSVVLSSVENDEHFLIHCADYLSSRPNIDMIYSDEIKTKIAAFQEPINPKEYVMPFGKHKGKKLAEVDKDYLEWLISTDVREPLKTLIPQILKEE